MSLKCQLKFKPYSLEGLRRIFRAGHGFISNHSLNVGYKSGLSSRATSQSRVGITTHRISLRLLATVFVSFSSQSGITTPLLI